MKHADSEITELSDREIKKQIKDFKAMGLVEESRYLQLVAEQKARKQRPRSGPSERVDDSTNAEAGNDAQNALKIVVSGWSCYAIGLSIMMFTWGNGLLYQPLFLATLVLGILLITKKRMAHGVSMVVALFLVPVFWVASTFMGVVGAVEVVKQNHDSAETKAVLSQMAEGLTLGLQKGLEQAAKDGNIVIKTHPVSADSK